MVAAHAMNGTSIALYIRSHWHSDCLDIYYLRDLGRFAKIKAGRPYASFGARL
jgi:hypothetical protein